MPGATRWKAVNTLEGNLVREIASQPQGRGSLVALRLILEHPTDASLTISEFDSETTPVDPEGPGGDDLKAIRRRHRLAVRGGWAHRVRILVLISRVERWCYYDPSIGYPSESVWRNRNDVTDHGTSRNAFEQHQFHIAHVAQRRFLHLCEGFRRNALPDDCTIIDKYPSDPNSGNW